MTALEVVLDRPPVAVPARDAAGLAVVQPFLLFGSSSTTRQSWRSRPAVRTTALQPVDAPDDVTAAEMEAFMDHIQPSLYQPPDDSDIAHEFTAWLAARRETLRTAAGAGRPRDSQADVAAPDAAGGEESPDNETGRATPPAPAPAAASGRRRRRKPHCVLYPAVYFWAISPQKRCQAPARSQHAPRPWALPAAARRPRAGCPGERPPPLAPQHPLPAHGRRASPRSRASRRFAHAAVYPRSLAIESDDPIFRVAEVCLHPLPKAHALWREDVATVAAAISH